MALTLQQIRDYVRTHIDIEVEDIPDTLMDVFIREGSKRIERAEDRWPFFEKVFPLTTVAAQRDYLFVTDIAADLQSIHSIRGEQWELKNLGVDQGDRRWPRNIQQTAEPSHYAVWNKTLRLYPDPNDAYDLLIRGYRTPTDWVTAGAGSTPDLPDELHNTVALWALSRAYNQQEDPELGAVYERMFSDELNEYRRRIAADDARPQPIVLNSRPSVPLLPYRMHYDWE